MHEHNAYWSLTLNHKTGKCISVPRIIRLSLKKRRRIVYASILVTKIYSKMGTRHFFMAERLARLCKNSREN